METIPAQHRADQADERGRSRRRKRPRPGRRLRFDSRFAAGCTGLTGYVFQAFDWPQSPDTPIFTEVSIAITQSKKALTDKDLPAIGATYANALAGNTGSKIRVPKIVKLPSGKAEYIIGTIPAGSYTNGVELYLIPHGKRLYTLAFQTIDARALDSAKLFTSIAQLFKITAQDPPRSLLALEPIRASLHLIRPGGATEARRAERYP